MGQRTNTAKWMENQKRWQINVQKDGQRRSFTSSKPGRTGQREANAKADAWLDNGLTGNATKNDVLLEEYLEMVQSRTSKSNYIKESYHVNNFIKPLIGRKKISNTTPQDFQDIIDKAYLKGIGEDGTKQYRSKKTLTNIRATIMAYIKFCRKKKATVMILDDLSIPKGARYLGKTILQPNDLITLFSIDTTVLYGKRVFDEYIYAYRFAVLTGLRPGELRALSKSSILGDKIKINESINVFEENTHGKNQNTIRAFTMSSLAKSVLKSQLSFCPNSELLFNIQSYKHFASRWKRYCTANGITPVSLYELRHTFISIVKTLPEGEIKPIVGHSESMDSFGIYGHEIKGEQERTAADINNIFVGLLKTVL